MIEALLRASLQNRGLVLICAVALSFFALSSASELPRDVIPDVNAPSVTVLTEARGLAPEEVEQLVTYPLETTLQGSTGLRRMRSASSAGLSILWLDFDWETTGPLARQRITERLRTVELPPGVDSPYLTPPSSIMAEIAFVAMVREDRETEISDVEMRRVAEVVVRRRLLTIEGVSEVTVIGGHRREVQIILDPARLAAYGLSQSDVGDAVERGTGNAAGGYLVDRGIESVVRVLGRAQNAEDIAQIAVGGSAQTPVRVRDIADVRIGPAVRRGVGGYGGEDAIVFGIMKQPGADTIGVTRELDRAIDSLATSLHERGLQIERESFRQSHFIERATDHLLAVLRDAVMIVALALLFFLWSPRATLVSIVALPTSLLLAILVLRWFDLRLDTMTLGGLAIAVGELVDDAIVDVENVSRRLRERRNLPEEKRTSIVQTVLAASLEVRAALISATLVISLVFLPLFALQGFEGRLLQPLAIAYLAAIGSSLFVAVTLTPVLASLLLSEEKERESPVERRLVGLYQPLLQRALEHRSAMVALPIVCVLFGGFALANSNREFLPSMNEGSLLVGLVGEPGTSLEDANVVGRQAEQAILRAEGVLSVTRRTGRADYDEHVLGPESTEIEIGFSHDDRRTTEERIHAVRDELAPLPVSASFGQPIGHRIDHTLHGHPTALAVRVIGEDLGLARRVAQDALERIEAVTGVVDAQVEPIVDVPQLFIDVDGLAAARYGFSRGEAARAIGAALWGRDVARIYEDGVTTPVIVRFPDSLREDRNVLRSALIPTPSGGNVPIEAIANLRDERAPNYIMRENAARRVSLTANIAGRDPEQTANETCEAIAEMEAPAGIRLECTGRFESERRASQRLFLFAGFALLGIFFVILGALRDTRRAFVVMANLPLALAGGVVGVQFSGALSLATSIGFITLFGIATRNGLLLATRVRDLEEKGVVGKSAIVQGASERLLPILITSTTAALGLLPLALSLGAPGAEIQAPMAWVILTGLGTSTVLNMFVVPSLLQEPEKGLPLRDSQPTIRPPATE